MQQEQQVILQITTGQGKVSKESLSQLRRDRYEAAKLHASLPEGNKRFREQIHQEKREHELELKLAAENNSVLLEGSITPSSTPINQAQERATRKYDLSKWK